MTTPRRTLLLHLALWLPIVLYALRVSHDFFLYADRAITLTTDDALANIAFYLAREGHYGFPSSPVLLDMPRDQGLFSYGPFYFWVAAALIWTFGYSLTIVRSVHLLVILFAVFAARAWFGRAAAGAIGAIVGTGLLVAFERGQWPMVRPDSMVTFFALGAVMASGVAMRTGRAWGWALAGVSAACGAFTHMVAWSLIPAMATIVLVYALAEMRRARQWNLTAMPWYAVAACALGGIAGTALFYASFDFRIGDQLQFLRGYQELTGSMGAAASGPGFGELLVAHFNRAYWYLPYPLGYVVWLTFPITGVAVVACVLDVVPRSREHLALLAPPLIVWAFYFLSLGTYNNLHSGYAILNQVMWFWTLGALGLFTIEVSDRWPAVRRTFSVSAYVLALGLAIGVLTFMAQRTGYRDLAARSQVSIAEYLDRVLTQIPAKSRAWGGVIFGIEHPTRVQLVQYGDAIPVLSVLTPDQVPAVQPDFLVWSYAELRESALNVFSGKGEPLQWMKHYFPDSRYQLVSLTAGAPYGVTRVYARRAAGLEPRAPTVAAYDPRFSRWSMALGSPSPLVLSAARPMTLTAGLEARPDGFTATQTVQAEMPAGTYLLRIDLDQAAVEETHNVWLASSALDVADTFGEFGAQFDISPRVAGEPAVHVVYTHPGGPAYISQFGQARGAILSVYASRVLPLPDFSTVRGTAPAEMPIAPMAWVHPNTLVGPDWPDQPGIRLSSMPDGRVRVDGNAVQFGYQAFGPKLPVKPFQRVRLRLNTEILAGTACIGILDGTGMAWLVVPDKLGAEYDFQVNDSETIKPVIANCSPSPQGIVPIRAVIGPGSYAVFEAGDEAYVPMLMRLYREGLAAGRTPAVRWNAPTP